MLLHYLLYHTPFVCLGNGDFERLRWQTSDYLCQSVNEVFPEAACLKCVIPGGHIGSLCHSRGCVTGGYLFLSSSSKTSVACMTPWFYCQIYWLSLMLWILFIKVSHHCESSHDLVQAGGAGVSTLGHLLRLHSVHLCVISMGAAPNSLTLGSTQLSSLF